RLQSPFLDDLNARSGILLRHECSAHHSVSFFFNDPPSTNIHTLSLHDALPICYFLGVPVAPIVFHREWRARRRETRILRRRFQQDRKSTRLNSSHQIISYAVFCLKKKQNQ